MLKLLTKMMKIKCLWPLVFQLETPQIIDLLIMIAQTTLILIQYIATYKNFKGLN